MGKSQEIVSEIMDRKGFNAYNLGLAIGEIPQKTVQSLTGKKVSTLKYERMVEMLEPLGYRLDLVEVGYGRVVPEFLDRVIDNSAPEGLFWAQDHEGRYAVVDSRQPGDHLVKIYFGSKEDMIKWLDMAVKQKNEA